MNFQSIYRKKLELFKEHVEDARKAWESFLRGRPIDNKIFLIDLEWQREILEELSSLIEDFSAEEPSRIYFLSGKYGTSKTQILKLINEKFKENVGFFTVFHDCRRRRDLGGLLLSMKNEARRRQVGEYSRKVLDGLKSVVGADDVYYALDTLRQIYTKGVLLLVDEFDTVIDDRAYLHEWDNFLTMINDIYSGVFIVLSVTPSNINNMRDMDRRTGRFIRDENIFNLKGRYGREKIVEVVAHYAALYASFRRGFTKTSLKFFEELTKVVSEEFGTRMDIRQANNNVMDMVRIVERLQNAGAIDYLYENAPVLSGKTHEGKIYEEGLKRILSGIEWSLSLPMPEGETQRYIVEYDGKPLVYRREKCPEWQSDGAFVVKKLFGDRYIDVHIEFPVEIKFVTEKVSSKEVKKIGCHASLFDRVYPIVFVATLRDKEGVERQFKELERMKMVHVVTMWGIPSLLPLHPEVRMGGLADDARRLLESIYGWVGVQNFIHDSLKFQEKAVLKEFLEEVSARRGARATAMAPVEARPAKPGMNEERLKLVAEKIWLALKDGKAKYKPLANKLKIDVKTVRAIMGELKDNGLITHRGGGNYVAKENLTIEDVLELVKKYLK